jgi:hypothetical protein
MHKQRQHLIKQKNYKEADFATKKLIEIDKRDRKAFNQTKQKSMRAELQKLKKRHEKEFRSLQLKSQAAYEDLLKQRDRQANQMLLRYSNGYNEMKIH